MYTEKLAKLFANHAEELRVRDNTEEIMLLQDVANDVGDVLFGLNLELKWAWLDTTTLWPTDS